QESGGLRAEQCDVRVAGDAAGALEHRAGSFEVSPDEGDVSEPDAGGGQAIGAVDSFCDGNRLATGGHTLLELPELGEAAREPSEVDRLVCVPGSDHRAANALRGLHDGSQELRSAPIVAEGVTRQAKIVSGVELERDVPQLVA